MNRRHFLGSILALGVAPAIVRADSLMRIVPRDALVAAPVQSLIIGPGLTSYASGYSAIQVSELLIYSKAHTEEEARAVFDYFAGRISEPPQDCLTAHSR